MSERSTKRPGDYFRVIWKRKWIILVLVALCAGGAYGLYRQEPKRFRTSMKAELAVSGTRTKGNELVKEFLGSYLDDDRRLNNQLLLLQDDFMKAQLLKRIRKEEPVPEAFRNLSDDELLDLLNESIAISGPKRGSSLVEIQVSGKDPILLPRLAHMFWAEFLAVLDEKVKAQFDDGLGQARSQRDAAKRQLDDARGALDQALAKESFSETRFNQRRAELADHVGRLEQELRAIDRFVSLKSEVYSGVKIALETEGEDGLAPFYEDDVVTSHDEIRSLRQHVQALRDEFARYQREERIGPGHFAWKAFETKIREEEMKLRMLQRSILANFVHEFEANKKEEQQIQAELGELRDEVRKYEAFGRTYDELKAKLEREQSRYDELVQVFSEIENDMKNSKKDAALVIRPDLPRHPYYPKLFLFLGAGLLIGLVSSFGLALGLEAIDDSLRTEDEVESALKLPCIGTIHAPDSRRGGTPAVDLASIIDSRSVFAEEFRSIRTSLGFTFDRRRGRHYALAVSSFEVQEGKTTVSTNLATVIAASGLRTLLVDGDMRNGRIHRTFGLSNAAGLSDVLAGKVELDDAVEETEIANLSVLTAGTLYDNTAEMLESPAMRQFVETLSERFDRVVFDTPPAGMVTDASVLGKQVDALILVAAVGKTRKRQIRKIVKSMQAIGVRIAGVVLNEMKPGRKRYYRKYLHLYRRDARTSA